MDNLKRTIDELTTTVQAAKDKQKAAKDECAKLERDMAEFKNNKEGKIDELKVFLSAIFNVLIGPGHRSASKSTYSKSPKRGWNFTSYI